MRMSTCGSASEAGALRRAEGVLRRTGRVRYAAPRRKRIVRDDKETPHEQTITPNRRSTL